MCKFDFTYGCIEICMEYPKNTNVINCDILFRLFSILGLMLHTSIFKWVTMVI